MKVAIIGSGAVGAALAQGWARKGHSVVLGVRDTQAARPNELASQLGVSVATISQAAAEGDVVVLAVPWDAIETVTAQLGGLQGKPLIDATNPLAFADGALNLVQPDGISGAERIAELVSSAAVVKTMNQVGAEMMSAEKSMAAKPCMFIAGDDQAANETAAKLVSDLGFEPLHSGALRQARHLEHFAMVWINQAVFQGFGRDWAFGALRDGEAAG